MYAASSSAVLSVKDFETYAFQKLNPIIWEFFNGAAEDEITSQKNQTIFQKYFLVPRVCRDVSNVSTKQHLFRSMPLPILIAPTASQKLVHPQGELSMAKAAHATDTTMIVSTSSSFSLAEIATEAPPKNLWFQLYVTKDNDFNTELVREAERYCSALVITVDFPVYGNREKHLKNKFKYTKDSIPANYDKAKVGYENKINWETIKHLKQATHLPVLLKGILHPQDALCAAQIVDGIIVSNHGGRQLDTAVPSLWALSSISQALKHTKCKILLDGGIRRGRDVYKALGLGAHAVCIGRPAIWGLVQGQAGVENVIKTLASELRTTMALCGSTTLSAIEPPQLISYL